MIGLNVIDVDPALRVFVNLDICRKFCIFLFIEFLRRELALTSDDPDLAYSPLFELVAETQEKLSADAFALEIGPDAEIEYLWFWQAIGLLFLGIEKGFTNPFYSCD